MALEQLRAGTQLQDLTANQSGWVVVENRTITASVSEVFSGLSAGVWYRGFVYLTVSSAGYILCRPNSDNGNNYSWASMKANETGGTTPNYGSGVNYGVLSHDSVPANNPFWVETTVRGDVSPANRAVITSVGGGSQAPSGYWGPQVASVRWNGVLSSLQIYVNAGTMTGSIVWMKLQ
jgi:hypothetical protein